MADDASLAKVEDALREVLEAYPHLTGTKIFTDQPSNVALEDDQLPALVITTVAYDPDQSDEQGQTIHTARVDVASIVKGPNLVIGRANHAALAHVIGAIHPDRTLGGRLQDLQEVDVAPVDANRADSGAVSIQFLAQWFTARGDWFTIIGQGGQQF